MNQFQKCGFEQTADFEAAARAIYSGKRILVTGAAGSIGSQLVLRLLCFAPARIAALDKDENGICELEQELQLLRAPIPVEPHIADLRDACRLESICRDFAPQVIFHAAAYKHVPLMELHPSEAILGNVMGTKNLLDIIAGFGAERFVFVSTDEALNPVNVMGATKRIGEMLVQAARQSGRVQGASVRFGNVLGSRGSVVPLFHRQIAAGGPVTLTHSDMVRYFITMGQAVEFILAAGCEAHKGEVFVAHADRLRNVEELAREMILLAGWEPGKDIEIRIVGPRPGERFADEGVPRSNQVARTGFEGLYMIEPSKVNDRTLTRNISHLVQAARSADPRGIYSILEMMGLGYKRILQLPPVESCSPSPPSAGDVLESAQSTPTVPPLSKAAAISAGTPWNRSEL
jgi:FlaA1/EpsC-like NDP-sugar epimerase